MLNISASHSPGLWLMVLLGRALFWRLSSCGCWRCVGLPAFGEGACLLVAPGRHPVRMLAPWALCS